MPAPRIDPQRWFLSNLHRPDASRTVLAGTDFANRLVAVFETAEDASAAVRDRNARLNANGPAEGATSPSPGPNNPNQENAVNEQHRTIAPADPATMTMEERLADTLALVQGGNYADATAEERHQIIADLVEAMSDEEVRAIGAKVGAQAGRKRTAPCSRPELFSTAINPVALAGLSLQHMANLYDACHTLMNVAAGIGCEPRFNAGETGNFNGAGDQADLFQELAAHCLAAIMDEAVKRKPADAEEALVRAWLLARDGANMRDDFHEFFRMVVLEHASMSNLRKVGEQGPAPHDARESAR